ncbi:MAG TPA: hypothetical protein VE760_08975, partial [Acidimicrobiales bacterium]|nr:hypothetical protein [Acidimicrobiales bacterium]
MPLPPGVVFVSQEPRMSVGTGVLEEFSEAVDRLVEVDPAALGDGEAVLALHRELKRLAAVTTRTVAAFDAGGAWEDDARSAASWLTHRCRLPAGSARARVRLGRALRHLPTAEAAWLAGEVGEAQVALLARAPNPVTEACMARDEELLVREAKRLGFASFARALAYWRWRADPEGAEDDAAAQRQQRRFSLSQSFGGVWFVDGTFDPIAGDVVARELGRIEEELFAADWAEAKARVSEELRSADLRRSAAQRRADALVEMATRSATAPADGRRPEPLFTVRVGYETLAGTICELAKATMVTPASLVRWSRPGWSGWSSTHPAGSSTWACTGASSAGPPAGRWRRGIASASTRPATCPPRDARSTTSTPGAE